MKYEYKGYIIKVRFWGDSITPVYEYKLYKPSTSFIFKHRLVWTENIHRNDIGHKISNKFDFVIEKYEAEIERWK